MRSECAEDGLEVVDKLGEGGVFERRAEAGCVEGDLYGGFAVAGEAEAAGGVGVRAYVPPIASHPSEQRPLAGVPGPLR